MVVLPIRLRDDRGLVVGPCLGGWIIRLSAREVSSVIASVPLAAVGAFLRSAVTTMTTMSAVTTDVHEHHAAHQAGEGDRRERDDAERDERGRDGYRRDGGEQPAGPRASSGWVNRGGIRVAIAARSSGRVVSMCGHDRWPPDYAGSGVDGARCARVKRTECGGRIGRADGWQVRLLIRAGATRRTPTDSRPSTRRARTARPARWPWHRRRGPPGARRAAARRPTGRLRGRGRQLGA